MLFHPWRQELRLCRPTLNLPLFLNDAVPEEHKNGIDMSRDLLRRSHVLVVCGHTVTEAMKNDIAAAQRLRITATTLEGIHLNELDSYIKGLKKEFDVRTPFSTTPGYRAICSNRNRLRKKADKAEGTERNRLLQNTKRKLQSC